MDEFLMFPVLFAVLLHFLQWGTGMTPDNGFNANAYPSTLQPQTLKNYTTQVGLSPLRIRLSEFMPSCHQCINNIFAMTLTHIPHYWL